MDGDSEGCRQERGCRKTGAGRVGGKRQVLPVSMDS